jgi:hypothetical protein
MERMRGMMLAQAASLSSTIVLPMVAASSSLPAVTKTIEMSIIEHSFS